MHLEGIRSEHMKTPRLEQHVLSSGTEGGIPVLFIHGNASSSVFWEEIMLELPAQYHAIAPDLRGYGTTEDKLIDATRGCLDWVDDLLSLKEHLGINQYHVVGHSLGGAVIWSLLTADAKNILSATLAAPGSPFGFGGTIDETGKPAYDDFASSGGGTVNPEFVRLMAAGDRSTDNQVSPRNVMNAFYWKPPFKASREEALLSSMLSEKTGPERYPGDMTPSNNWPNVAPGRYGPINALSPKYVGDTVKQVVGLAKKPAILWVRGADDQIVSDSSFFDFATLGQMGVVPGWPGAAVLPPQPMIKQTRYVLEQYQAAGGQYSEIVFDNCGHTPYLENPRAFMNLLLEQLAKR
jgi:pimeloyl-ACP methyl ester carboxylesterase